MIAVCRQHRGDRLEVGLSEVEERSASRSSASIADSAHQLVDSRRDGTWVYYSLAAQEHAAVEAMLGTLTRSFGAERALRADHAKLRRSCGPGACK